MVKTQIVMLKEKIKALAALQRRTKRARKTSLPVEESAALRKELSGGDPEWGPRRAASEAEIRRVRITACLNLYHELRGSAHRHAVREGMEGYHERFRREVTAEIVIE